MKNADADAIVQKLLGAEAGVTVGEFLAHSQQVARKYELQLKRKRVALDLQERTKLAMLKKLDGAQKKEAILPSSKKSSQRVTIEDGPPETFLLQDGPESVTVPKASGPVVEDVDEGPISSLLVQESSYLSAIEGHKENQQRHAASGKCFFQVNDKTIEALFDSGSTVNIICEDMAIACGIMNDKYFKKIGFNALTANGTPTLLLGVLVKPEISCKGVVFTPDLFVSKTLPVHLLLGRPFEQMTCAQWDNRADGSLWGRLTSPSRKKTVTFRVATDYWDQDLGMCAAVTKVWPVEQEATLAPSPQMPQDSSVSSEVDSKNIANCFTLYKLVAKKVRPVNQAIESGVALTPFAYRRPMQVESTPELLSKEKLDLMLSDSLEFLTAAEVKRFKDMLCGHGKAFAYDDTQLGYLNPKIEPPVVIHTIPHVPWQKKQMRFNQVQGEAVRELLRKEIEAGLKEPCQGPYRNSHFVVAKKNGKYRHVIDLQPLNAVTYKDAAVPPDVNEMTQSLCGAVVYSALDCYSGYNGIGLDVGSRDLTGIQTPFGSIRCTTLPTGWTGSVGIFQRVLVKIFFEDIYKTIFIFIDNMGVKGPTSRYNDEEVSPGVRRFIWEHIQQIEAILAKLEWAGLKLGGTKCCFGTPTIEMLSYECTHSGRKPVKNKLAKISNWIPCKDETQV